METCLNNLGYGNFLAGILWGLSCRLVTTVCWCFLRNWEKFGFFHPPQKYDWIMLDPPLDPTVGLVAWHAPTPQRHHESWWWVAKVVNSTLALLSVDKRLVPWSVGPFDDNSLAQFGDILGPFGFLILVALPFWGVFRMPAFLKQKAVHFGTFFVALINLGPKKKSWLAPHPIPKNVLTWQFLIQLMGSHGVICGFSNGALLWKGEGVETLGSQFSRCCSSNSDGSTDASRDAEAEGGGLQ